MSRGIPFESRSRTAIYDFLHSRARLLAVVLCGVLAAALVIRGVAPRHSAVKRPGPVSALPLTQGPPTPQLDVQSIIPHGDILEVKGKTDPGVTLMINGEKVVVFQDGTFKHFEGPLPPGPTVISVTAQNDQGGVNTQQLGFRVVPEGESGQ